MWNLDAKETYYRDGKERQLRVICVGVNTEKRCIRERIKSWINNYTKKYSITKYIKGQRLWGEKNHEYKSHRQKKESIRLGGANRKEWRKMIQSFLNK